MKEKLFHQLNCMYEFPYGDLVVGTTESLHMFRDGEQISSTPHRIQVLKQFLEEETLQYVIDGLGRAHILDAKVVANDDSESLYPK